MNVRIAATTLAGGTDMTIRHRVRAVSSNQRFVAVPPHEDYVPGFELVLNRQGRRQEAGS